MAKEIVTRAVKELEDALNRDKHNCDIWIENVGDSKEVAFYIDGDEEPVATLLIVPAESAY